MCEETSTSASSVAGASTEELFNQDSAMNSRYLTQAFPFSSGNPRIEETRGVMHLYRNDIVSSSSDLPVERKPLFCVPGVPNHMTYADFCQFCGSFTHHMLEMRIVRNDGVEDQYSVLIRSDRQSSADSFYKHFNGKQFSSIKVEACRVLFTVDVQYTGSIEHSQSTSVSSWEQPSCPVCLALQRDWIKDMGGILTTICNHSFHCSCISKWTDSSCPVYRYCQQQPEKSTCFVCQTSENLWMCILCGFVGCGRYKEGHAVRHWKETQHCYSLELETRRVLDYAGENYVHRLIQSKTDGKLVELNHHCAQSDGRSSCKCGVDTELTDAHLDSKVEAIVNEYNELLTTQRESQKLYFESLHQEVEEEIERETSEAIDKALNQNKKLQKLKDKLEKCIEEKKFLDEMNDNLLRNQELWETKISEIGEREKKALVLKDEKIQDLEEQLKSLMASFESENTVETESTSDEIKKGVILPTESSSNSDSK